MTLMRSSSTLACTPIHRQQVAQLVRQALRAQYANQLAPGSQPAQHYHAPDSNAGPNPLLVNVSARHVHVTQADLEILFGPGAKLTKLKDLYQEGEFASEQLVNLI